MRYCTDTDIHAIRDSVLENLSADSLQPVDFQAMAGRDVEMDIVARWYSGDEAFNARLLPYSFDYDHKQGVIAVPVGGRVDKNGVIYEKISSALSAANLSGVTYTDTAHWKEITCSFPRLFRDLAVYKTLFCIYRYQAGDSESENTFERQRDYFLGAYESEFSRIMGIGIDYDLDSSGVIDDEEKRIKSSIVKVSQVATVEW